MGCIEAPSIHIIDQIITATNISHKNDRKKHSQVSRKKKHPKK